VPDHDKISLSREDKTFAPEGAAQIRPSSAGEGRPLKSPCDVGHDVGHHRRRAFLHGDRRGDDAGPDREAVDDDGVARPNGATELTVEPLELVASPPQAPWMMARATNPYVQRSFTRTLSRISGTGSTANRRMRVRAHEFEPVWAGRIGELKPPRLMRF